MYSKTAVILGNGESRKGIDYRKEYPDAVVYGCNGAYREDVDRLVCVDVYMQHLIYESGYCRYNVCYFNEWEPIDGIIVESIAQSIGLPIKQNEPTDMACVRGDSKNTYVTWLSEDKVVPIPDIEISSGSRELLLALETDEFDKVILLGFDGVGSDNIYKDTRGYENSIPLDHWVEERQNIMNQFKYVEVIERC